MALQTLPGRGLWLPEPPLILQAPAFSSSLIDATGEKWAWMGRVWNPSRAAKSIRKVGFLLGTVTKAGGSALTVSLQDVSVSAGGPMQPDGTQDQTVAIANADAGFATGLWYQSAAFSSDRSVAHGELLAVVIEYDGAGRLGSDAVNLSNPTASNLTNQLGGSLFTASWAAQTVTPNILLEFSDGTFGTLDGAFPCSALSTLGYNSGSATDEWALEFSLPFPCKVDGAWVCVANAANTRDFDVVLYSGTTAMTGGTVSCDANASQSTAGRFFFVTFSQEIQLAANTVYHLAAKPTTASSISLHYFDVSAAAHLNAHPGGTGFILNGRVDAGAWGTATATRRPMMGVRVSSLDDAAGGAVPGFSSPLIRGLQ